VNPLAVKLGALALQYIVKLPFVLRGFSQAVKDYKRMAPTDADIQALPDDEAAIELFARAVQDALVENAAIKDRLREKQRDGK
jgi:hypothetical protein